MLGQIEVGRAHTRLLFVILVFFTTYFWSQNIALANKRVALVIGNSAYTDADVLKNPYNDANDISAALKRLGFKVVLGLDLDYLGMRDKLKEFSANLDGADTALFYYAGHAMQVDGENFIAPVDTVLKREDDLVYETFTLRRIREMMERKANTLLMFLDACRDNPLTRRFSKSSRSIGRSRGLAPPPSTSEGTLIAFSTQPENVALDGDGRNSPFTQALLENIEKPGLEISKMMTNVRRSVYQQTNQEQIPWTNSSLFGDFYFSEKDKTQKSVNVIDDKKLDELSLFKNQKQIWDKVQLSNDPAFIKQFIANYPDGFFTSAAVLRLQALEKNRSNPDQLASLIPNQVTKGANNTSRERTVDIFAFQEALNRVGCDAGTVDGKWGSKSERALRNYAKHANIELSSLKPSFELLETLKNKNDRICPLVCGVKYNTIDNKCVLKTCHGGQKLSSKGVCYTPKTTTSQRKETRKSSSGCFTFNGETICD